MNSYRDDVLKYAAARYSTKPEYPWARSPESLVLRHTDNQKWYGIIMRVFRHRLGLDGDGQVDILNVKCDAETSFTLLGEPGFKPGYHMNKKSWLTILLDGSVSINLICKLIDKSFEMTAGRFNHPTGSHKNREWIVPANPKYYDIENAFAVSDTILWKQSSGIIVGDIIYLYVGAPVSALLYRCRAVEVNIPYSYEDSNLRMNRVMKIKLLNRFENDRFTFQKLKNEYGVYAVRGPRSVPNSLHYDIMALCGE